MATVGLALHVSVVSKGSVCTVRCAKKNSNFDEKGGKGFFVDCSITLMEGMIGNRIEGTISLSYACRVKNEK